MILAILALVWGYQKAKATGRNPFLWAIIAGAAFMGTQIIVGLMIGIFLGLGVAFFGWSESIFDTYYWPISIVSWLLGILCLWLVLRFLDRPLQTQPDYFQPPPPPPPTFGGNI
jgi:hypothetical protein